MAALYTVIRPFYPRGLSPVGRFGDGLRRLWKYCIICMALSQAKTLRYVLRYAQIYSKRITQFYMPPTHEPYLPLLPSRKASSPFGWYSLRLPTKEWPGWVDLDGCLHTEINVPHRESNPDTVIHPSTYLARRIGQLRWSGPPRYHYARPPLAGLGSVVSRMHMKLSVCIQWLKRNCLSPAAITSTWSLPRRCQLRSSSQSSSCYSSCYIGVAGWAGASARWRWTLSSHLCRCTAGSRQRPCRHKHLRWLSSCSRLTYAGKSTQPCKY